jgi:hypothetical protein
LRLFPPDLRPLSPQIRIKPSPPPFFAVLQEPPRRCFLLSPPPFSSLFKSRYVDFFLLSPPPFFAALQEPLRRFFLLSPPSFFAASCIFRDFDLSDIVIF